MKPSIFILSALLRHILWASCLVVTVTAAGTNISLQQQRLTLEEIEALIKVPTPDRAIAKEIKTLTVDFEVRDETITYVREVGGGPLTIAALLSLKESNDAHRKTLILVADFRGVNNDNRGLTEMFLQQLRKSAAAYPEVKIESLGETITGAQGSEIAITKGKQRNAAIVLWGWFVTSPSQAVITLHIDVLRVAKLIPFQGGTTEYRVWLSDLDQFSLHPRLSKDLTSIVLSATAFLRMDARDYEGAIARFTEALEIQVSQEQLIAAKDIYLYRALAYFLHPSVSDRSLNIAQALADIEQSLKIDNKQIGPVLLRAYCLLSGDKAHDALAEGQKLLEQDLDPSLRLAVYDLLIDSAEKAGGHEQAVRYGKELLNTSEKSAPSLSLYRARARAFSVLGREKEELASLNSALELKISDIEVVTYLHFRKGTILKSQRLYSQALEEFKQVVRLEPQSANAHNEMGIILYWKKEYDGAISHFNKAISLDLANGVTYGNRGRAYQGRNGIGDSYNALKDFNKSLELRPDDYKTYYDLAVLHWEQNAVVPAILNLDKCLEMSPEFTDALYLRGHIRFDQKAYDDAISDYTRIIKLQSTDSYAFFCRGKAYKGKGDVDSALADYNQSIDLNPNDDEAYLERGLLHVMIGKHNNAVNDLSRALRSDKESIRQEAKQELLKLGIKQLPGSKRYIRKRAS